VRRFMGWRKRPFQELPEAPSESLGLDNGATWAPLIAEAFGIPQVVLSAAPKDRSIFTATADFRDQYYGLVPHVEEANGSQADGTHSAALITTGLIDPDHLLWGTRSCKFNKRNFEAPLVNLTTLNSDEALAPWAQRRLIPKLLLATQTKVIEVVVDESGVLLPSVPVITVEVRGTSLWHGAAVLMSPPVTAWAATQYMGSALSSDAIKLSAQQVQALPNPEPSAAWDQAAECVKSAHGANSQDEWQGSMHEFGKLMCQAFDLDDEYLLTWWKKRLPTWI